MERPPNIPGDTTRIVTGCGKLYITCNKHPDRYREVFLWFGKSGGCQISFLDSIARLISFALNSESKEPLAWVIKAMSGVQCPSPKWTDGVQILSCSDGISKVLKKWKEEMNKEVECSTLSQSSTPLEQS